jgi:hypothetical protein
MTLLVTPVVLVTTLLRRRSERTRQEIQAEIARHRQIAERERQSWIYPFET